MCSIVSHLGRVQQLQLDRVGSQNPMNEPPAVFGQFGVRIDGAQARQELGDFALLQKENSKEKDKVSFGCKKRPPKSDEVDLAENSEV